MGLFDPLLALLGIDVGLQNARNKEWAGDIDGAIKSVQGLIQSKGATAKRLNFLAWFLIKKGEYQEALKYAGQAIEIEPKNTEWQATRARALRRLGRKDEALALMRDRFEALKSDIFNSTELCELLLVMGHQDEAVAVYRDMESRFAPEADMPLAIKIGMTQGYREAQRQLRAAGLI